MNEKELLPCPFCGGTVRIAVVDDEGNAHGDEYENDPWSGLGYMLYHDITEAGDEKCPIARHEGEGLMGIWIYDTREEAVEAWNKRYVPPAKTLGDAELVRSMKLCVDVKCNSGCQFHDEVACRNVLITKALDLINRQKTEIERLQVGEYRHISKTVSNARIEAIEDFAEKLKEKAKIPFGTLYGKVVYVEEIDKLLKEMTEDEHD